MRSLQPPCKAFYDSSAVFEEEEDGRGKGRRNKTVLLEAAISNLGMYCMYNSTSSSSQVLAFFDLQYISCVTFYMQRLSVKAIHCTFAAMQTLLMTNEIVTILWNALSPPLENADYHIHRLHLVP